MPKSNGTPTYLLTINFAPTRTTTITQKYCNDSQTSRRYQERNVRSCGTLPAGRQGVLWRVLAEFWTHPSVRRFAPIKTTYSHLARLKNHLWKFHESSTDVSCDASPTATPLPTVTEFAMPFRSADAGGLCPFLLCCSWFVCVCQCQYFTDAVVNNIHWNLGRTACGHQFVHKSAHTCI